MATPVVTLRSKPDTCGPKFTSPKKVEKAGLGIWRRESSMTGPSALERYLRRVPTRCALSSQFTIL